MVYKIDFNLFLINLYNRPERLIHTLSELRKVNLSNNVTRIEACTPEQAYNLQHQYLSKKAYLNIKKTKSTIIIPNYKALACAISHINIWKNIVENNLDYCLIVEDDIEINDSILFKMEIDKMINMIKDINSFDNKSTSTLITFNSKFLKDNEYYYYNHYNNNNNYIDYKNDNNIIFKRINNKIIGCHFYYINNKAANILLKYVNSNKITYQIDIEIFNILHKSYEHNCHLYNLCTKSIYQSKKFISDIQWFNLTPNSISIILKLPLDICENIFKFITNFTNKKNELLFDNIYY